MDRNPLQKIRPETEKFISQQPIRLQFMTASLKLLQQDRKDSRNKIGRAETHTLERNGSKATN